MFLKENRVREGLDSSQDTEVALQKANLPILEIMTIKGDLLSLTLKSAQTKTLEKL